MELLLTITGVCGLGDAAVGGNWGLEMGWAWTWTLLGTASVSGILLFLPLVFGLLGADITGFQSENVLFTMIFT